MNNRSLKTYLSIGFTLMLAMMCMILPIPHNITWLRPNWLALILIYWVIFSPSTIGVVAAFITGLFFDLLCGVPLGSTGLVLAVVAFLTNILRNRLKQIGFWQRSLVVIILVSIQQLLYMWLQVFLGRNLLWAGYWGAIGVSVVVWPLLFLLLQSYQRRLRLM